jgi:AcrR family transcriptional regulator
MPARRSYHHGDLRRTLLDASLALVQEQGIQALSLREVARKAGVSHNAPYHHFPDKGALMAAICQEGFEGLAREMAAARAGATDDPRARLEACGQSYVRFALSSPAHFRVMFRPELADAEVHPEMLAASQPAFQMLVQGVVECQQAGQAPAGDPMPLVLTCWSAVHGLASLWLDGPLSKDPKGFGKSPDKLAAMVVLTLAALLAAGAEGERRPRAKPAGKRRLGGPAGRPGGA